MTKISNFGPVVGSNTAPSIVIVGDLDRWARAGRDLPRLEGFTYVTFDNLFTLLSQEWAPDIILSPLIADNFDAVDVARLLLAAEYQGRYRAINDDLPDVELILNEIADVAPLLDFSLLAF